MSNPVKLFIVEGENRDYRFVNEMTSCFFCKGKYQSKVIQLPASQNIYMLYKQLEKDGFDTDIVELLRDSVDMARIQLEGITRQEIDEVFLFFDYDIHQDNLSDQSGEDEPYEILGAMLSVFDNENDNGKLFISYPMVEALYDYREDMCEAFSKCFISIDEINTYKMLSGKGNPKASQHLEFTFWKQILEVFALRLKCLFNVDDLSCAYYRNNITPYAIFEREKKLSVEKQMIFVISAFPEFLLDYFKDDFWHTNTRLKKNTFDRCFKENGFDMP